MVRAGAGIRCDGVVEYCYEWNNFGVWGSDTLWDITKPDTRNRAEHAGFQITPRRQARECLTWLGNIEPT